MTTKKTLAPKHKTALQHLRKGFRDTDAADALDLLSRETHEMVLEVFSSYYASPDTLRSLVKDEFIRHLRYYVFERRESAARDSPLGQKLANQASEAAIEAMKSPEYQEALLENMKAQYLAEYEARIKEYTKDRAWRDAHHAYEAAFRLNRRTRK